MAAAGTFGQLPPMLCIEQSTLTLRGIVSLGTQLPCSGDDIESVAMAAFVDMLRNLHSDLSEAIEREAAASHARHSELSAVPAL